MWKGATTSHAIIIFMYYYFSDGITMSINILSTTVVRTVHVYLRNSYETFAGLIIQQYSIR